MNDNHTRFLTVTDLSAAKITINLDAAIEPVARAMAIADGFDPDERASGGPNDFAAQAKDFNGYAVCHYGPVWQKYQRQARLIIHALNALGMFRV